MAKFLASDNKSNRHVSDQAVFGSPLRFILCSVILSFVASIASGQDESSLKWTELTPSLPNKLGVAGPFAGVHHDHLIVAGGANFAQPVWDHDKQWLKQIHVARRTETGLEWLSGGELPRELAYGAAVSTERGVLCMGGSDSKTVFSDVFMLSWNKTTQKMETQPMQPLPKPFAYGAAVKVSDKVYVIGGQTDGELSSAAQSVWMLELPGEKATVQQWSEAKWQVLEDMPAPSRSFHLAIGQHNGFNDAIYVISGRRQQGEDVQFLKDCWEWDLKKNLWRKRAEIPQCVMAGTGIDIGQSHIGVFGGASGENYFRSNELKDAHPGFPKTSFLYHTITNTWTVAGATPANHVTTTAVKWGDQIVIPSGEIRPRVRSPKIWQVDLKSKTGLSESGFGAVNYAVLIVYLIGIVGVGFWVARRNKNTDQYFRGGKSIPWWAAGCSIFATMLSSLTYTGVPSKAYAQDWVYAVGNFMIPIVAIAAVFIALPFFRRIDATSAYEYLEHRFNRSVRLFGSASFTIFHIFRMAIVMSLTALALSVATPLSPIQSVLLMGVLSILYCSVGGIEAVIWTDTIQTFVLMGGALVAIFLLVGGIDNGVTGFFESANASEKLKIANFHWDATDAQIAFWVIIAGGLAQNISSYTSDQAVVQRYMTTSDQRLAARSIWTNAVLTIPATLMFFGIGTALFVFYQHHPERLDPTIKTDQIFPMFIAREMPVGLAGLLVAGIFAAAQSTVSTSMNSTATTIVTDFMKPNQVFQDDRSYLRAAQFFTVLLGIIGTGLAVLFVANPDIKSFFDAFIKVIGLFMGVLGGLFVLGVTTRRANGTGALIGGVTGAVSMFLLWMYTPINGYLYTAAGIGICFVVGYIASLAGPSPTAKQQELTLYFSEPEDAKDELAHPGS